MIWYENYDVTTKRSPVAANLLDCHYNIFAFLQVYYVSRFIS